MARRNDLATTDKVPEPMIYWHFELNAPGMSALHRAGLAGLAASLKKLKEKGNLQPEWEFELRDSELLLPNLGTDVESLMKLLQTIYALDDEGLVDFPILADSSQMLKAHVQQVLLGTFLQHPQSRKAEKQSRVFTLHIDDQPTEIQYLPLKDFQHRSGKNAEKISKAISKNQMIEVAGWAFPGGMVRHNAHKETALAETPKRYFLLLCAPLGCLYFHGRAFLSNGDFDPKSQYVLAIPRPISLKKHVRRLLRFYANYDDAMRKWLYVAGECDATLLSATMILLAETAFQLNIDLQALHPGEANFQVMRFGQVGWSRQQKTRTGGISTFQIKPSMIRQYYVIHKKLSRKKQTEDGETFIDVMPMKNLMAENILWGRPWYRGFGDFLSQPRGKKVQYWRKELNEVVQEIEWADEAKRQFIDYIQTAVRNRFGQVKEKAEKSGADVKSMLSREYERMVLAFSKCRTKESFREELVRFLATTRPNISQLKPEEKVDLVYKMAIQTDWKETRDLCLLAIATYTSRSGELDPDVPDSLEDGQFNID